jgi:hypothetical protein
LDRTHFVDHGGHELADVIDGESPHTLAGEPIVGVKREGERVFVETRIAEVRSLKFYEYELREANAGDWRIVRLREFLDPPDAPFLKRGRGTDSTTPVFIRCGGCRPRRPTSMAASSLPPAGRLSWMARRARSQCVR